MLPRTGSSADGAAGRPHRGTKRKTTAAKGSSAERRRNLRNERMATIDYIELVARLTTLVAQVGAPKVTLEQISQLYQVCPPLLPSTHASRPARRLIRCV